MKNNNSNWRGLILRVVGAVLEGIVFLWAASLLPCQAEVVRELRGWQAEAANEEHQQQAHSSQDQEMIKRSTFA